MEQLASGNSITEAALELGMKKGTLDGHLRMIGNKTGASSLPTRVHAALNTGQVKPPPAPQKRPDVTPAELRLLAAVAMYSARDEIATAAGVAQSAVHPGIMQMGAKAGASNTVHLIGLAHAWGLLGPGSDRTADAASASASTVAGGRR